VGVHLPSCGSFSQPSGMVVPHLRLAGCDDGSHVPVRAEGGSGPKEQQYNWSSPIREVLRNISRILKGVMQLARYGEGCG